MRDNTEIKLMLRHQELIKRIGYDRLLELPDHEKACLMSTLNLSTKVQILEKVAERIGV